jgi:hypothetical protein
MLVMGGADVAAGGADVGFGAAEVAVGAPVVGCAPVCAGAEVVDAGVVVVEEQPTRTIEAANATIKITMINFFILHLPLIFLRSFVTVISGFPHHAAMSHPTSFLPKSCILKNPIILILT